MPSFNQAEFLAEAVESVLTQRADIELVVMDGGSTDGSVALLADLGTRFGKRLRWWSGADSGPADAINRAVEQAQAPLIGWLNSDDLYVSGAIDRALAQFAGPAQCVMHYGEAEHVDVAGRFLERYPTERPSVSIQTFRDRCFICQPSAFFTRAAFLEVGGLDQTLKAAFDFDLWVRMFQRFPNRIGFVPEVQARSRLHGGGITLKFRERVAREGIAVVSRYFKVAPGHWLLTHFEELLARHPEHDRPLDLLAHCHGLFRELGPSLEVLGRMQIERFFEEDARLQLASTDCAVGVYPDGWAGPTLRLRIAARARSEWVLLVGRHQSPIGLTLTLRVCDSQGQRSDFEVAAHGLFQLELPTPKSDGRARWIDIECSGTFVPAEWERGSTDQRELAFRVTACELLPIS